MVCTVSISTLLSPSLPFLTLWSLYSSAAHDSHPSSCDCCSTPAGLCMLTLATTSQPHLHPNHRRHSSVHHPFHIIFHFQFIHVYTSSGRGAALSIARMYMLHNPATNPRLSCHPSIYPSIRPSSYIHSVDCSYIVDMQIIYDLYNELYKAGICHWTGRNMCASYHISYVYDDACSNPTPP